MGNFVNKYTTLYFCLFLGHKEPLGNQGAPSEVLESMHFTPSGKDFYQKYLRNSNPVLFKKSVGKWPAFTTWQNLSHLRNNYGKNIYNVDFAKIYSQQEVKQKMIPLEEYLDIYKSENVTLESNISRSKMLDEVHLPALLQCKELYPAQENIHIVISSGKISSPLYQVDTEVLRVSLSGSSTVILFNSKFTKDLCGYDFLVSPCMSNVIPHQVDLEKFPEFTHLPFFIVEMQPGMFRCPSSDLSPLIPLLSPQLINVCNYF